MVFYSICATHYQGSTTDKELKRFLNSVKQQGLSKEVEVIIIHDGPLHREWGVSTKDYPFELYLCETVDRANKWGHNNRSYLMQIAEGYYIINTNTDNKFYKGVLKTLKTLIGASDCEVFITRCRMKGLEYDEQTRKIYYSNPRDYNKSIILNGKPPVLGNVDMFMMVASRNKWKDLGYWKYFHEQSDASLIEEMTSKNDYENLELIIGEHY